MKIKTILLPGILGPLALIVSNCLVAESECAQDINWTIIDFYDLILNPMII